MLVGEIESNCRLSINKAKFPLPLLSYQVVERVLIECRKIKTKVISAANRNKGKCDKEPMRTHSKHK